MMSRKFAECCEFFLCYNNRVIEWFLHDKGDTREGYEH